MSVLFEQQLANHCAPALTGIKASNLVSCQKKDFPSFQVTLWEYQQALSSTDIRFCVLCECSQRYLLLVYREKHLAKQLFQPEVQQLLLQDGYPLCKDVQCLLQHLSFRFSQSADFPHEIGLFLGYPVEDVIGFQTHKGKDFQLCGYWKVYNNPEYAQNLFHRFDQCRNALCRRVQQGHSIIKMFAVA